MTVHACLCMCVCVCVCAFSCAYVRVRVWVFLFACWTKITAVAYHQQHSIQTYIRVRTPESAWVSHITQHTTQRQLQREHAAVATVTIAVVECRRRRCAFRVNITILNDATRIALTGYMLLFSTVLLRCHHFSRTHVWNGCVRRTRVHYFHNASSTVHKCVSMRVCFLADELHYSRLICHRMLPLIDNYVKLSIY